MRYYSYAGEARGTSDPEKVDCVTVEGEDCGVDGCMKNHCSHTVIMWSGNEYSRNHTWIAAGENYTVDLEDAR